MFLNSMKNFDCFYSCSKRLCAWIPVFPSVGYYRVYLPITAQSKPTQNFPALTVSIPRPVSLTFVVLNCHEIVINCENTMSN